AGVRDDVPRLLGAMDAFVFPSLWEGLPLALLEAQAAGAPCIISDAISEEADVVRRLIYRAALARAPGAWAGIVLNAAGAVRPGCSTERRPFWRPVVGLRRPCWKGASRRRAWFDRCTSWQ